MAQKFVHKAGAMVKRRKFRPEGAGGEGGGGDGFILFVRQGTRCVFLEGRRGMKGVSPLKTAVREKKKKRRVKKVPSSWLKKKETGRGSDENTGMKRQ